MRPRTFISLALMVVAIGGGATLWAASHRGVVCASGSNAMVAAPASAPSTSTCDAGSGAVAGRFDPAMSGVCRFSCATRIAYDPKQVVAQPGAARGQLTQCPVSGVVFVADAARPQVHVGAHDYYVLRPLRRGCVRARSDSPLSGGRTRATPGDGAPCLHILQRHGPCDDQRASPTRASAMVAIGHLTDWQRWRTT